MNPPKRPRSYADLDAHGIWWWVSWDWGTGRCPTPVQVAYKMSPMLFVDPHLDKDGRERLSRLDDFTDVRWRGPCLMTPSFGNSLDDGRDAKRDARTSELRSQLDAAAVDMHAKADNLNRASAKVSKISVDLTSLGEVGES